MSNYHYIIELCHFDVSSNGFVASKLFIIPDFLHAKPDVILCGWLGLKHQLTN